MIDTTRAFSGFSVNDIAAARVFYEDMLGMRVTEANGMLRLELGDGRVILVYPKDDHQPATYTILNFPVDDIDKAVHTLTERGVAFLRYEMTDDHLIARGDGPQIAWFTDPAGNIMSVLQEQG